MHLSTSALLLACAVAVPVTNAWMPTTQTRSTTSLHAAISRQDFFQQAAATAVVGATAAGIFQPLSAMAAGEVVALPNGVTYTVTKKGDGPKPDIGELAAIRFKAYFGEVKIDDIFDTPEPYYTRVGSGALVKGVEDILPMMVLGDRWVLTIPSDLAFGKKGRPSSAGKPRIPANSVITFDVEIVGLPGKEPELIELIGDV